MIKGPHDELNEDQLCKAQGMVSTAVKACVHTISADRGIHAFLLQHAYQNVANFITINRLTYLERDLVTKYISNGFRDPREQPNFAPLGDTSRRSNGSRASGADETPAPSTNVRTVTKKSTRRSGGGGRSDGREKSQEVEEKEG